MSKTIKVPNHYIVINNEHQSKMERSILRTKAQQFAFPLTKQDLKDIKALEEAFDNEKNIAGLAAPQIGISKQAIIFEAQSEIGAWRSDLVEPVTKTIWLNPSYQPLGDDTKDDFEGCFSVDDVAGVVPRYKKITYEAYLVDGSKIAGQAEGYIARVMQHEIDHVNGVLFVDKTPQEKCFSLKEYYRLRSEKMSDNNKLQ